MNMPFEPQAPKGETGHPDTVIDHQNQVLHVFLQERDGNNKPWALRQGKVGIPFLKNMMDRYLSQSQEQGAVRITSAG